MKTSRVLTYVVLIFILIVLYQMIWGDINIINTGATPRQSKIVHKTNEQKEKIYQDGINQISSKEWDGAVILIKPLQEESYKDSKALFNYALAQQLYTEDFMGTGIIERILEHLEPVQASLNEIDINYSGLFAQDIALFRSEIENKRQKLQADLKESNKAIAEENAITPGCRKLWIGMGQADATTSMGKPRKINRSTGSYGTHEQWCYNGGVYLYFEDGILSSWQD